MCIIKNSACMNCQYVNVFNIIICFVTNNSKLAYIIIRHCTTSRTNIA